MLKTYFIALVTGLVVSLAATPFSIWMASRWGAMDPVDPRKIHSMPRPRWGGIGIMAGFLSGIIAVWMFVPDFGKLLKFSQGVLFKKKVIFTLNLGEQLAGILFGALVLFITGIVDDRKPMKPGMKLSLQVIAAYVAMTYGVRIYGLSIPGFEAYSNFPLWMMQVITILWLVGLSNAVNLIDGLDGLAGGVVAIVAGSFLAVALIQEGGRSIIFIQQMKLAGVIAAALMGGLIGFLVYNFYPASVFMGDSGSLSIGFLVGCVAVIGAFKTTILAVLFVPFVLVAVPMTDMAVAFFRRLLQRQNPFAPDRGHFHHRLLAAGWTQREAVLLVYSVTLLLACISITVVALRRG
ncbi:MAG: putative undecaprenyl-phosphate N-acetylglucosaminyl 1-phosphate transferase [Elusimicrobia bacterium]|nr:putative undecaprenyl-phosphate N-acetylglucosaminyl 1-phosphate transferase [Elusimicrobiota bacterium]